MAEISPADTTWIMAELTRRGVTLNKPCPECSHPQPSAQSSLANTPTGLAGPAAGVDLSASFVQFLITCNNCGFVRAYLLNNIGYRAGIGSGGATP
jgi:hypothetical protein